MPEQQYGENLDQAGEWKPRPDPTVLSTAALQAAIAGLRELLAAKIDANAALTDEKFSAAKGAHSEQKERINRLDQSIRTLEGREEVRSATANSKQTSYTFVVSIIAVLVSVAGVATVLFINIHK